VKGLGLAADYPNLTALGFPQFTSFFDPDYSGKLRYAGLDLPMTVSTYQNAFIQLGFNLLPGARVTLVSNPKPFILVVLVMKIQRAWIFVVAAHLAFPTFIFDCQGFDFASSLCYRPYQFFSAVGVFPLICH